MHLSALTPVDAAHIDHCSSAQRMHDTLASVIAGPALQVTERPERLLTDRSAYILYLESQLERVTAACMTVHSFEEQLEDAANHLQGLEEKGCRGKGLAASMQWLLHMTGNWRMAN